MTDQNNAARAAEQDPLSDEYVNAVIRQHGYASPEAVIARLGRWIGLNGGENSVTLLMYEAHKALSKLRAEGVQAGDERAAFEDAWRKLNSPIPMNTRRHDDGRYATPDIEREWRLWQARAALASAPVADAQSMSGTVCGYTPGMSQVEIQLPRGTKLSGWLELGSKVHLSTEPAASAPVAGEAQPVAWFIDWPDEPELGHYIAESPAATGRSRPLVFADAVPQPSEPVYAYRRKGLDDFVTCDRERFDELSAKPRLFETRIFYAAPQASEAVPQAVIDALKGWTGAEPSQAMLARAVDAWLDPGAVWESEQTQAAKDGGDCAKGAGDVKAWIDLFWSVAKELNCLPSSFVDGNEHVLRAARKARAALSPTQPTEQGERDE
jgi:hypothetical protein